VLELIPSIYTNVFISPISLPVSTPLLSSQLFFRMEAVFAWCKGAKFVDVQKLTGTFEGTTIRTLRRLEELVRQLANAAKSIGNHELQTKFEKGSELLKRDIVFCSSLYL
jgi:ATP-dependent RNA helicase DOB1